MGRGWSGGGGVEWVGGRGWVGGGVGWVRGRVGWVGVGGGGVSAHRAWQQGDSLHLNVKSPPYQEATACQVSLTIHHARGTSQGSTQPYLAKPQRVCQISFAKLGKAFHCDEQRSCEEIVEGFSVQGASAEPCPAKGPLFFLLFF